MGSKMILQRMSMLTSGDDIRGSLHEKSPSIISNRSLLNDLPVTARTDSVDSDPRIRSKPWDKSNLGDDKHKLRIPLLTPNAYGQEHAMKVLVPPRVLIRIERLLGTDRIMVGNSKCLENISKKIDEEDHRNWKERLILRRDDELTRHRYLILNGFLDTQPDEVDRMKHHPMYRVNQAIKKIKKFDHTPVSRLNPVKKLPSGMSTLEPFEEYERTGRLFYNHPEHYLKTKPLESLERKEESIPSLLEKRRQSEVPKDAETLPEESNDAEEWEDVETEEWNRVFENFVMREPLKMETSHKLESLIRRGSMTAVKRILGLRSSELDKRWKKERSSLLDVLYKEDMEKAGLLYSYAQEISDTYKRENKIAEHFCNTKHRKLFASN